MISLTRLNQQELILNADLIKSIEQLHDTVITLVNGEKLTVIEPPAEILRRVSSYRRAEGQNARGSIVIVQPPQGEESHGSQ
ncbi:MAG: flagellar FlbD family protein [Terriglobales bacterium]